MKRFYLTILLVSLLTNSAFAQSAPGYLGHRFSVGYHAFLSPTFKNPVPGSEVAFEDNDPSSGLIDVGFGVNFQHHLVADFVVSKSTSVGADLLYSRSAFIPSQAYDIILDEYGRFSAVGIILQAKRYNAHFAPLGSFWEYRLGYATLNVEDFHYHHRGQNGGPGTEGTISGGSIGGMMAGLGIGVNRVIRDRYMLTWGLDISIFPKGWRGATGLVFLDGPDDFFDFQKGDSAFNQQVLLDRAAGRFLLESILNFKVGVSFLP